MSKNITATIGNGYDSEKIRLKVGEPVTCKNGFEVCEKRWSTGISLENVFIGLKWFVIEYDSIWDRGNGSCVGTYFVAYDMTDARHKSDILSFCERLNLEVPSIFEVEEA